MTPFFFRVILDSGRHILPWEEVFQREKYSGDSGEEIHHQTRCSNATVCDNDSGASDSVLNKDHDSK